ncbi:MAG: methyltransferase [Christensenellaceae bacterium]|jgi:tRNA1(Val) A37 N6-methylase TrmN6|nr:methyltransferase [Christensenellaceae bacterium]
MLTIEDLQESGLKIAVDKTGFCYGQDAVLLARFTKLARGSTLLDLGCGCGILSILLQSRFSARVTAVDVQPRPCELLEESARRNGQPIRVLCADLRALYPAPGCEAFDTAVCNPPYHRTGTRSPNAARRVSTHQDACDIAEVARCAARMLKNGGRLTLCYPAPALAACFAALVNEGLAPKRLQLVCAAGKPPYLALIEARKGGGEGLLFEDTIVL